MIQWFETMVLAVFLPFWNGMSGHAVWRADSKGQRISQSYPYHNDNGSYRKTELYSMNINGNHFRRK